LPKTLKTVISIAKSKKLVRQVTKPMHIRSTLHYKTHELEKDGLFCELIFGPIKSGLCTCGKYQAIEKYTWFKRLEFGPSCESAIGTFSI